MIDLHTHILPGIDDGLNTEDEAVEYAAAVVAAGASGIAFGRNTWGAKDPKAMAARLHAAVHGA